MERIDSGVEARNARTRGLAGVGGAYSVVFCTLDS